MDCPKCLSENTQVIQMLILSGTQTGSLRAVSINNNLNIGITAGKLSSSTSLVQKYHTPMKPAKEGGLFLGIFFIFLSIIGISLLIITIKAHAEWYASAVVILVTALMGFGAKYCLSPKRKSEFQTKLENWEKRMELLNEGWVCLRCGHDWIPN